MLERIVIAAAGAALLLSSAGCTGLQNWKADVENKAASNACNDAGWTEATGRHQECIANTRTAWAQQRAQETQSILVGGALVAALSGAYREPSPAGNERLRRAELFGSYFEGMQLICQYQTDSGMVRVVGPSGSCPAEYLY